MKKRMFQRIGAMALSAMMAFSLMATPAFAAMDNPDVPNLTISGAIKDVRYDVYPLLVLANQTGDSYEYKLATDKNGNPTDAAKAVQGVINGFLAKDNNGYGFELVNGNRVVFRVVPQEVTETNPETSEETNRTETMDEAYARWKDSADGMLFLTKFADAVKDAAEKGVTIGEETKSLGNPVASVTDNDANDLNVAKGTIEVDLETGYYLVISSAGQRAMVSTQGSEGATIKEKNKAPTLEKKVLEHDNSWNTKNDAKVGDKVMFQAVIEVGTGVNRLQFSDALSNGLKFANLQMVRFIPAVDNMKLKASDLNNAGNVDDLKKVRTAFYKSVPTETNMDGEYAGSIDLWEPSDGQGNDLISWTNGDHALNITFKSQWLESKRSFAQDSTDENASKVYDRPPMVKDDSRLHAGHTDAALYNMYIGDVADPTDDGGLIVIRYAAEVTDDAVIGGTGNPNEAKVVYGNDPTSDIETDTVHTNTYVYQIDVLKFEKDNETKNLSGAEFDLYRLEKDGKIVEIGKSDSGNKIKADGEGVTIDAGVLDPDNVTVADSSIGAFVKVNDTSLVTDSTGRIPSVTGLDAGVYAFVETKAPDGYIQANGPVYAVIGGVYSNTAGLNDDAVDMNVYVTDGENADGTWTFRKSGRTDTDDTTIELVGIANASGLVMPETGGIGTTIFYVVGGLLACGAVILLVVKKRMTGNED